MRQWGQSSDIRDAQSESNSLVVWCLLITDLCSISLYEFVSGLGTILTSSRCPDAANFSSTAKDIVARRAMQRARHCDGHKSSIAGDPPP